MRTNLPRHVAIIPDGNRRWAKEKGLPRLKGHEVGAERMFQIVERLRKLGVRYASVWGFSTDNWKRQDEEVLSLFQILESWIKNATPWAVENNVKLRHIGRSQGLPDTLHKVINDAAELTKNNDSMTLNVAFNYSGRAEIIDAVNSLIKIQSAGKIDENTFSNYLYTDGTPDVDLVIRTAGEYRLSNFMLWQTAYSEFYFVPLYWPDFDVNELDKALETYNQRIRRLGGD